MWGGGGGVISAWAGFCCRAGEGLVLVLGVLRVSLAVSRPMGEGFALLPESELLLLCLPREEVTKKRGHPARRPPRPSPLRVR